VWSLTPREGRGKTRVAPSASESVTAGAGAQGETVRRHAATEEVPVAMHEEEGAWWQSPVVMGAIVLALTVVLYLIFA
jgi:SSS family solute:Na+ symporter